jgi:WD40 repeat protein
MRRETDADERRPATGPRWALGVAVAVFGLGWGAEAPKEAGRTDLHGDPLPAGALARLGTLRWRHGTPVTHVAFLPNGKTVLTASQDNRVRLWDLETGKELRRFDRKPAENGAGVGMMGGRMMVWAVGTAAFGGGGFHVALAPDGKTLAAAGADNVVQLWDVATGKELRQIKMPPVGLATLLFSPDGKILAVRGAQPTIYLWDATTGKELRQLTTPQKNPAGGVFIGGGFGTASMAFSPDGKILAAGETTFDNGKVVTAVKFWETAGGKELRQISAGQQMVVSALAYAPDGKTLAYAFQNGIHICAADTGKEIRQIKGQDPWIKGLVYSPDGKTLAVKGTADPAVRLLDPETGKVRLQLGEAAGAAANALVMMGMGGFGCDLAFSPDGKLVATGEGSTVRLWEAATGKEMGPDGGHRGPVTSLIIAPGGVGASRGGDNTVRLWEGATGKERSRFPAPEGTTCVALAPDGRLAALGNADGSVRLHETAAGKELHKLKGHANGTGAVAFSPDGKTLASRGSADNTIRLYDAATGKELRQITIPGPEAPAGAGAVMIRVGALGFGGFGLGLVFSPDGKTLASPVLVENAQTLPAGAGGTPNSLTLWDVSSGKEIHSISLSRHHGFASFAFSPDGRTLAAENLDQTVSLWEVAGGKERARLGTAPAPANPRTAQAMIVRVMGGFGGGVDTPTIAFAPDGRTLAVKGHDSSVHVWDVAAGKEMSPLKGHDGSVTALAFAPDGKTLDSGASDTTILLWDLAAVSRELKPQAGELQAKEVEGLWADLAGDDAARALQGIRKLAGAPAQAVPALRERLRPATAVDARKIGKWIADLDSEEFAVRQRSEQELEKLGELAVPALTRLKAEPPSLESKRRAEQLLEKVTVQTLSTEQLRLVRALEVLELAGTAEARRLLEELAKGAPGALPTREAQAALDRLARQSPAKP